MMKCWKDQTEYDIQAAVESVGHKYGDYFRNNTGLPPSEFGPFLDAANMTHEPMENLPVNGWLKELKDNGLLWIGTLAGVSPSSGLHSRIVEGMSGDGSPGGTFMAIIDPAGGRRYSESFSTFVQKYEGAIRQTSGTYYQIRHFS
jgi:Papain-like cysteine protease AvrRpt2